MNTTSRMWRITGMLSAISTVLLVLGFLFAVKDITRPMQGEEQSQASPEPNHMAASQNNNHFDVTSIGDSLAKGTGDDTGRGFAKRTVELLNQQGTESILINNLGINGLTSTKLLPLLDEKGVQYSLKQAGVIILSIGGNDLFDGNALLSGEELPSEEELEEQVKKAGDHFKDILAKLHEINNSAKLVYVGLYNPFSELEGMRDIGNKAVSSWNLMASGAMDAYEGSLIVPTYDLYMNNSSRYLSSDHFHPNGDGYQLIAERIVQGLAIPPK
ncbi:Spore germination lipase LipC [compost metagenome]